MKEHISRRWINASAMVVSVVLSSVVLSSAATATTTELAPGAGGLSHRQAVPEAAAAQYSPPEWWPLRGSNLIGCSRNSPEAICEGNYHPAWDIDIEGPSGQPVYASGSGQTLVNSNSTDCSGYGRSVRIHHNGRWSLSMPT